MAASARRRRRIRREPEMPAAFPFRRPNAILIARCTEKSDGWMNPVNRVDMYGEPRVDFELASCVELKESFLFPHRTGRGI